MNGRLYLFATLLAVTLALSVNHQTAAYTLQTAASKQCLGKQLSLYSKNPKANVASLTIGQKKVEFNVNLYDTFGYRVIVVSQKSLEVPNTLQIKSGYKYGFSARGAIFIVRLGDQNKSAQIAQGAVIEAINKTIYKSYVIRIPPKYFTASWLERKYSTKASESQFKPATLLNDF